MILAALALVTALGQDPYPDYSKLSDTAVLAIDCEKTTLDADRPYASCISAQAEVWERRVNREYAEALRRVDPEMRRHVRDAQAAWKVFETATCAQWDDVQGTLSVRRPAECYLEQNKRRVEELQALDGLAD